MPFFTNILFFCLKENISVIICKCVNFLGLRPKKITHASEQIMDGKSDKCQKQTERGLVLSSSALKTKPVSKVVALNFLSCLSGMFLLISSSKQQKWNGMLVDFLHLKYSCYSSDFNYYYSSLYDKQQFQDKLRRAHWSISKSSPPSSSSSFENGMSQQDSNSLSFIIRLCFRNLYGLSSLPRPCTWKFCKKFNLLYINHFN